MKTISLFFIIVLAITVSVKAQPSNPTVPSTVLLPVTLVDFTASVENGSTVLQWETAAEQNTADFKIQYSTDGNTWNVLEIVPAAGNSNVALSYEFIHKNPVYGNNYYRLEITDLDGSYAFSKTRLVKHGISDEAAIFPNPAKGDVLMQFSRPSATAILVYDAVGRVVYRSTQSETRITLPFGKLSPGTYKVVFTRDDVRYTKTIVRQ